MTCCNSSAPNCHKCNDRTCPANPKFMGGPLYIGVQGPQGVEGPIGPHGLPGIVVSEEMPTDRDIIWVRERELLGCDLSALEIDGGYFEDINDEILYDGGEF